MKSFQTIRTPNLIDRYENRAPNSRPRPRRLPLPPSLCKGWALELARRWNGGTYSLFILHGNIFDLFPVQDNSHAQLRAAQDVPGAPPLPGARLPAVLRHQRRPDVRLRRHAEALLRVAGSL